MENKLPKRKPTRLASFDYSTHGAYFITICTDGRRCILSTIDSDCPNTVGGDVLDAPKVQLTQYGKIVDKYINELNNFYQHITVERYVIMPNHIHLILYISCDGFSTFDTETPVDGASRTSPPTSKQHSAVSRFVSTLKRFCNKECCRNLFQRSFYDHVIRNQKDYDEIAKYIYENPIRWKYDQLYSE